MPNTILLTLFLWPTGIELKVRKNEQVTLIIFLGGKLRDGGGSHPFPSLLLRERVNSNEFYYSKTFVSISNGGSL